MSGTALLFSRASFHGRVVEERHTPTYRPVEIGGPADGAVAVPVPDGTPYIARVTWTGPVRCEVTDAHGRSTTLEPGRDLVLSLGDVTLTLLLVEPQPMRRVGRVALGGALSWLAVVAMLVGASVQLGWLWGESCQLAGQFVAPLPDVGAPLLWVGAPFAGAVAALFVLVMSEDPRRAWPWLALPALALSVPAAYELSGAHWKDGETFVAQDMPQCRARLASGADVSAYTAEYLARLLREDYDGNPAQGVIDPWVERPDTPKRSDQYYLPAGAAGPTDRFGGAEHTAPRPIRVVAQPETAAAAPSAPTVSAPVDGRGRPVTGEEQGTGGVRDGTGTVAKERREQQPAEREKGVGLPDWYDERDRAHDQAQVARTLRLARERLAIDPNERYALALLSHYQYLAQDYESALASWDRYILLYPDANNGYNNKALIYKRLGRYAEEEELYRQALAVEPGAWEVLNNLALNLAHQRRFEEALDIMRSLESSGAEDPYADLHRAKIYAAMGKDEEALRYLEKSLEGMKALDTLHHIEYRQDIRVDPSFAKLRESHRFRSMLSRHYGKDSPLEE